MNEVLTFERKTIRMVGATDRPEWIAKDVADLLGIGNVAQTLAAFPDDEKGITTTDTPGGTQQMLTLTEPGLYRMLYQSRKPEAERFRRWMFHEVLPAIRKTGSYSVAKPANKAEWLLQQAQLMVEHENRLAQQESRVQAVEQLALAALDVQTSNYGHYTILAWCRLKGINLNVAKSGKVGKKLTKIMRVAGRAGEIGSVNDTRFGPVNTYPEDILEKYFDTEYQE